MRSSVSMRGGRPPRSSRAIADCVVPTSSASSRWERPFSARRSDTLSAIAAKNQPRSRVAIFSCNRSSGRFSEDELLERGDMTGVIASLLCIGRRQSLVEEPAEEERTADGEERHGSGCRAECGQVVQEDLSEDDGEEREAADA